MLYVGKYTYLYIDIHRTTLSPGIVNYLLKYIDKKSLSLYKKHKNITDTQINLYPDTSTLTYNFIHTNKYKQVKTYNYDIHKHMYIHNTAKKLNINAYAQ